MFYPLALSKYTSIKIPAYWQGWLALGFGPSLFTPTQTAFLTQWNLRLGIEVVPSVLLTLGVSWRQIDLPTGRLAAGDIVAVDAGGQPPAFEQKHEWVPQFNLGLAIDLATVGKVIADASTSKNKTAPSDSAKPDPSKPSDGAKP